MSFPTSYKRITKPRTDGQRMGQFGKRVLSPRASYSNFSNQSNQKLGGDIYDDPIYLLDQKRQLLNEMIIAQTEVVELRKKLASLEEDARTNLSTQINEQKKDEKTRKAAEETEFFYNESEKLKSLQNEYQELEHEINEENSKYSNDYKEKLKDETQVQKNVLQTMKIQIEKLVQRKEKSLRIMHSDDIIFRQAQMDNHSQKIKILKERIKLLNDEEEILNQEKNYYEGEEKKIENSANEVLALEKRLSILSHTRENRERELAKLKMKQNFSQQQINDDQNEIEKEKEEVQSSRPKTSRSPRVQRVPDFDAMRNDAEQKLSEIEQIQSAQDDTFRIMNELADHYREHALELTRERKKRYEMLQNTATSEEDENKANEILENIKKIKTEMRALIKRRNEILNIETEDLLGTDEQESEYSPNVSAPVSPPAEIVIPRSPRSSHFKRNEEKETNEPSTENKDGFLQPKLMSLAFLDNVSEEKQDEQENEEEASDDKEAADSVDKEKNDKNEEDINVGNKKEKVVKVEEEKKEDINVVKENDDHIKIEEEKKENDAKNEEKKEDINVDNEKEKVIEVEEEKKENSIVDKEKKEENVVDNEKNVVIKDEEKNSEEQTVKINEEQKENEDEEIKGIDSKNEKENGEAKEEQK